MIASAAASLKALKGTLPQTAPDATWEPTTVVRDLALIFAERCFPVFPITYPIFQTDGSVRCSCDNPACVHIGKHPHAFAPHGLKSATTNLRGIERQFKREPRLNYGIPGGPHLAILDSDPRHGGDTSLAALVAKALRPAA